MSDADKAHAESFIGRVISNRYRVNELIAMGGMGAVYAGEHALMRKRIAIKILHPSIEQRPILVRRFEREAIAGAHVQHQNVAAATDFGQLEDGAYFLILEYVDGLTLNEIIRRGPLPVPRAVNIARQIASALEATHAMGIVHRDVKPLNVMIVESRRDLVKLIDFGFAKVPVDRFSASARWTDQIERPLGNRHLTGTGVVFGTISYIAPEAAFGMHAVDALSDLYALGLIFYEMLAGKHPFLAKDPVELFGQQCKAQPPPIAEHAPGVEVPPELEAVVMRLLEKHPLARYKNATAFIAALDEVCAALNIQLPKALPSLPPAPEPTEPARAATAQPDLSETELDMNCFPGAAPPTALTPATPVPVEAPTPAAGARASQGLASWGLAISRIYAEPLQAGFAKLPETVRRHWRIALAVLAALALLLALRVAARASTGAAQVVAPLAHLPALDAIEVQPVKARAEKTGAEALVDAVNTQRWTQAIDLLNALAEQDPSALADDTAAAAACEAAAAAANLGGWRADRAFETLATRAGTVGTDLLYRIVATQSRSAAAQRASALLRQPSVASRATAATRVAFDLRDAPCAAKVKMLDRAIAEGDARTLDTLETVVAHCYRPPLPKVTSATEKLRRKLEDR